MPVTFLRAVDTIVNRTDMTLVLRDPYLPLGENDQSNQQINKQVIPDCGHRYEETHRMIGYKQ